MEVLYGDIRRWYVIFWPKTKARFPSREWLDEWWAWGGYRHVSAFGYSPRADVWVHFNPQPSGIEMVFVNEGQDAQDLLAVLLQCGDVICVEAQRSSQFLRRGPFTCVSAVSHLIGVNGALTPWGLRKKVLALAAEKNHGPLPDDTRCAKEPADTD